MIVPLFMDEVDIFLRTITDAVGDCSVTASLPVATKLPQGAGRLVDGNPNLTNGTDLVNNNMQ